VTAFLADSLYVFAACAALGLIPAAVLAAKALRPAVAVLALLVAAFVIYVLVASAGRLR
jgi:hypothetical protein